MGSGLEEKLKHVNTFIKVVFEKDKPTGNFPTFKHMIQHKIQVLMDLNPDALNLIEEKVGNSFEIIETREDLLKRTLIAQAQ